MPDDVLENQPAAEEPSTQPDYAQLQAELAEYRTRTEDLSQQLERRNRETMQVLGTQGKKLDDAYKQADMLRQQVATLISGKLESHAAPPLRPPDPLKTNDWETEMAQYVGNTVRAAIPKDNSSELKKEIAALRQQISDLGFGMAVRDQRDELKAKYQFTDDDIREAVHLGDEYGVTNLKAAAMYSPALEAKIASASRSNGTPRPAQVSPQKLVQDMSRTPATPPPAGGSLRDEQPQNKAERISAMIASGEFFNLPDAEQMTLTRWVEDYARRGAQGAL